MLQMIIAVASHRPYWMPGHKPYQPVLSGAVGKTTPDANWLRDDVGENISLKNPTYCELTVHYWVWKHVTADYYGLCHYRRYFAKKFAWSDKRRCILSGEQLARKMRNCDVLLPHKRHYWIETNYSQYVHAHHEADLCVTKDILSEKYPDFIPAWNRVMKRRSGHRFNMFIMREPVFACYSTWLFDVLQEVEQRLDISDYSSNDRRVFGYIGERLLDVWMEFHRPVIRECRVVNLEPQHWGKKILSFLKRKYTNHIR